MKRHKKYNSISDIRLARARLEYENKFYKDKLLSTSFMTFPSLSLSMKNLRLSVRNNLYKFSVFRSLVKSNIIYGIVRQTFRLFRKKRSKTI